MMTSMKNRTVLITGASRGIGAAMARGFAAEGASVVLLARSATSLEALAAEIEADGGQALAIGGDVSVWADVEGAVSQAMARFGALDVLINNAGVIEPIAWLADSDPAA